MKATFATPATGAKVETVEVPKHMLTFWYYQLDSAITRQRESADCGSFFGPAGPGEEHGLSTARRMLQQIDQYRGVGAGGE
jgi:hypothetical protein